MNLKPPVQRQVERFGAVQRVDDAVGTLRTVCFEFDET